MANFKKMPTPEVKKPAKSKASLAQLPTALLLALLMILVFLVDTSLQELGVAKVFADLGVTLEVAAVGLCVVCPVLYLHIFRGPKLLSTSAPALSADHGAVATPHEASPKKHSPAAPSSSGRIFGAEQQRQQPQLPRQQGRATPPWFEILEASVEQPKPAATGVAISAAPRQAPRLATNGRRTPTSPAVLQQPKDDHRAQAQRSSAVAGAAALPQVNSTISLARWNQSINAAAKAGFPDRAERLLSELERAGLEPDSITFNSVVHAYAKQGDIRRAELWLSRMRARGVQPDVISYNTLMDA